MECLSRDSIDFKYYTNTNAVGHEVVKQIFVFIIRYTVSNDFQRGYLKDFKKEKMKKNTPIRSIYWIITYSIVFQVNITQSSHLPRMRCDILFVEVMKIKKYLKRVL